MSYRDAIFKPPACVMMDSDSSESEFEGFLPDKNRPTFALSVFNESDIEVSEVSSVSSDSTDSSDANEDDDVDDSAPSNGNP